MLDLLKLVLNFTAVKFEIAKFLPMNRKLWATHVSADMLKVERYLNAGTKVCYIVIFV